MQDQQELFDASANLVEDARSRRRFRTPSKLQDLVEAQRISLKPKNLNEASRSPSSKILLKVLQTRSIAENLSPRLEIPAKPAEGLQSNQTKWGLLAKCGREF